MKKFIKNFFNAATTKIWIIVFMMITGLVIIGLTFYNYLFLSSEIQKMEQAEHNNKVKYDSLKKEINSLKFKKNCNCSKDEFERLVMSVIDVESGGNPNAKNADCYGLMQIKKGSYEPIQNVISGSSILAHYIAKSANNANFNTPTEEILHRALTSYNRGWRGSNNYKVKYGTFTSEYSKKVLKKYYSRKYYNRNS